MRKPGEGWSDSKGWNDSINDISICFAGELEKVSILSAMGQDAQLGHPWHQLFFQLSLQGRDQAADLISTLTSVLPHLMQIARAHEAALDMDIDLSDHPVLLPVEVDARARVRVRVWDPLFDTFLKRNWARGVSNIHRRR